MTTNAARAETLVRALHAGIDGDHEIVGTLVTDDVRAWTPAFATATRDELIEALDHRDDAFSDMDLRATPRDVGGDFACVEWSVDMTHTGVLSFGLQTSVDPTGTRVTVHGITVAEFDGDRILLVPTVLGRARRPRTDRAPRHLTGRRDDRPSRGNPPPREDELKPSAIGKTSASGWWTRSPSRV